MKRIFLIFILSHVFFMAYSQTLKAKIRVYLEGAIMESTELDPTGRPLMRDNLRSSIWPENRGQRFIPSSDPYKFNPQSYEKAGINLAGPNDGKNRSFVHVEPDPSYDIYHNILFPANVFSKSGQNAIVDWIFVELRDKNDKTQIIATRSGLLQRDGDIVDLDGTSALNFPAIPLDAYYVAVKHRSHLGVMSANPIEYVDLKTLVDFTSPSFETFDFGIKDGYNYTGLAQNANSYPGYNCMWAGALNIDKKVKICNPNDDLNIIMTDIIIHDNNPTGSETFDGAFGYLPGDLNMDGKSKLKNPNDDTNRLVSIVRLNPLNPDLKNNFEGLIEQIPY